MIAAYTFSSAEDLTSFCARHEIGGSHTYAVLQSHTSGQVDGYPYDDFRLTILLDMQEDDLALLRQAEALYQEDKRARESAEQEERWRQEEEQRRAQREQRRRDAESFLAHRDDIPF